MQVSHFKSAGRLITGQGATASLKDELLRLNIRKPFVVTDPGVYQSGALEHILCQLDKDVAVYKDIPPEPEIEVIENCLAEFNANAFDGIIAVGGGSAIDSAKVLAVAASQQGAIASLFGTDKVKGRHIPLIAIPTTAGTGSEVTNIAILSDPAEQLKKGIVSDYLLPDVAIVSPEMTLSCPKSVTAASGIDALVHAIESYLSVHANAVTDALAIKAMQLIYPALPKAYARGDNIQAREHMATGSLLAGLAFGNAGVGAVHALAYPLGGRYHLSHGLSNAVMLPHVLQWNLMASRERFTDIAAAIGLPSHGRSQQEIGQSVVDAITTLCREVEIPARLREFSIQENDIPLLAKEASKVTRLLSNNPRALSESDIERIYRAAY